MLLRMATHSFAMGDSSVMASVGDLLDDFLTATAPGIEEIELEEEELQIFDAFDLLKNGDVEKLADILRDSTVSVNHRDPSSGRALLHEASVSGNLEAVKLLLSNPSIDVMARTMMVLVPHAQVLGHNIAMLTLTLHRDAAQHYT